MQKILISQCLLGIKVRYDGGDCFVDHPLIQQWMKEGRIVQICPEVSGGMSIPRPPSQIIGAGGGEAVIQLRAVVKSDQGEDVTAYFLRGAQNALNLVQQHDIKVAILKERSPSCGSSLIHDGTFSGVKIPGDGVTSALLKQHGVRVFNEMQLDAVADFLKAL